MGPLHLKGRDSGRSEAINRKCGITMFTLQTIKDKYRPQRRVLAYFSIHHPHDMMVTDMRPSQRKAEKENIVERPTINGSQLVFSMSMDVHCLCGCCSPQCVLTADVPHSRPPAASFAEMNSHAGNIRTVIRGI